MTEDYSERAGGLGDRGIALQAVVFGIVGIISVALLQIYSDSDALAYRIFENAVTRFYWAFVLPMVFVIDRSRKMFETRAQIRSEVVREESRKARTDERDAVLNLLKERGVNLPPEVEDEIRSRPLDG